MGATSVTGVSGPGDSNGKYKPENNNSCCGIKSEAAQTESQSKEPTIILNTNVREIKGC